MITKTKPKENCAVHDSDFYLLIDGDGFEAIILKKKNLRIRLRCCFEGPQSDRPERMDRMDGLDQLELGKYLQLNMTFKYLYGYLN